MNLFEKKIDVSIISQYRAELMGYGILFIMLSHCFSDWMQFNVLGTLFGKFTTLIHTQGFFFLSGFGLYFSFVKNSNVIQFYNRRLLRLYLPFLIMSFPFYIYGYFIDRYSLGLYFLLQSALDFFFVSSGRPTWYVSATIFLYIVFPYIYKLIFHNKPPMIGLALTLCIWLIIAIFLYNVNIAYYKQIDRLVAKFPMFILGIYAGYMAKNQKYIKLWAVIPLCFLLVSIVIANKFNNDFTMYYKDIIALFGLIGIAYLLKFTNGCGNIGNVLKWLGTYSLELYIFHMLIRLVMIQTFNYIGYDVSLSTQRIIAPLALILSLLICRPVHFCIDSLLARIK